MRHALAALSLLTLVSTSAPAQAFCGFYVGGAGAKLFNNATQVVLMREGTRTVLSMANNYQGPPENFAMVVPVPVVLQKENVKTLPRELFARIDKLTAPRLVEYWERDPCTEGIGLGTIGTIGFGSGQGFGSGMGRLGGEHHVKVLAEFAVGEYDIVILGADDSMALEQWLKEKGYKIPEGAEPHLRPYVASGSKFFVAKVDTTKVTFKDGQAQLSPLRFHYDSETFSLPIRLGLINANEAQDLIVNIIARDQRYEAANYPNVTIPTNLDVTDHTLDEFGSFYAALFDQTLARHPRSVVTEYAWDSGNCDPCPEANAALDGRELLTLGADVLPTPPSVRTGSGRFGSVPQVRMGSTRIEGRLPPEVVQRIVRQNFGRFRLCYENGLRNKPTLGGRVEIDFTIDKTGATSGAKSSANTTLQDPAVVGCITRAFDNLSFPQPEGGGVVKVTYPIDLSPPPGALAAASASASGSASAPPPPPVTFVNPGGFVLTRLHARYRKDGAADDLVFRPAPPIVGGREIVGHPGNKPEQGARSGSSNTFQGRYAIRHPWQGAITCADPARGRWGGPPSGTEKEKTKAATDLAFVKRDVPLSKFLPGGFPEGAVSVSLPSAPAPGSSAPAPATPAAPAASVAGSPAPSAGKCGCRAPGERAPSGAWPALLAIAALAGIRRRLRC